jgi:N,N'-diacetyllegionaminate synthase
VKGKRSCVEKRSVKIKTRMMISIGKRKIGDGEPCFIIAEAGVNHNGDPECARKLIDAAVEAQADAIKFQTFIAENLVTPSAQKAEYQKKGNSATDTQFQMLKSLELSEPVFKKLAAYAKQKGILFLSTAFDEKSLEMLFRLHVTAFKVPSGEITNFPFLKTIAEQRKPVILSTGMSTMAEVKDAVSCLREYGCKEIVILHCTTSYPAPPESVNLRAMNTLREEFHLPVGYSDHTAGISIPIAAAAMGACVIEKHFTLDRNLPGPDHAASLEPADFRQMVRAVREVESAAGNGKKDIQSCEVSIRDVVRKSIVAAKKIAPGSIISEDMLMMKRPGTGIEPRHLQNLIGKTATGIIKKDTVITWDMVE